MCLDRIKQQLKGRGQPVIGYKVAFSWDKGAMYGPFNFFRQQHERWIPNKWYRCSYQSASFISPKGNPISKDGRYKKIINIILKSGIPFGGIRPLARTALTRKVYEPGFHFFTTEKSAQWFVRTHKYNYPQQKIIILCCQFKEVTSIGRQWGRDCKVARMMKILNEVPMDLRKTYV